jgi:hypothetical protein
VVTSAPYLPPLTFVSETAAADTAVTVTLAAEAGVRRAIGAIVVSATGGTTPNPTITIADGETTVFEATILPSTTQPTWTFPFDAALIGSEGNAVTVTLSAFAGMTGIVNVGYYDA